MCPLCLILAAGWRNAINYNSRSRCCHKVAQELRFFTTANSPLGYMHCTNETFILGDSCFFMHWHNSVSGSGYTLQKEVIVGENSRYNMRTHKVYAFKPLKFRTMWLSWTRSPVSPEEIKANYCWQFGVVCIDIVTDRLLVFLPCMHFACLAQEECHSGPVLGAFFQFMQTGYDTIVFLLIIAKTASIAWANRSVHRGSGGWNILKVIAAQGLIYYAWVRR